MTMTTFGKWVRHNRVRLGLTLLEMSEDFGSKPSLMCDYEVGRKEYPPRLKAMIQHYFKMIEAEKTPEKVQADDEKRQKVADSIRQMFEQAKAFEQERKEKNLNAFVDALCLLVG